MSIVSACSGAAATPTGAAATPTGAAATPTGAAATPTGAASSPSTSSGGQVLHLGIVLGLDTNASYQSMFCGAKDAAAKIGNITVAFNGTPGTSPADEVPLLDSFLQTKPDGVIVVPTDPNGMQAPLQQVVQQGVKLVVADIAPLKPVGLTFIGPDNTLGGAYAAQYLAAAMGNKGTVYINSYIPGTSVDVQRVGGFKTWMAANAPDIKMLPTEYSKADPTTAATQTAAALRAHPEITGLYGQNELTANGMATAVREAGVTGKIPFVAYDADQVEVTALKAGTYNALISQGFYWEGYNAVVILSQVLRGQIPEASIPANTVSPIKVLTKDNVDDPSSQQFIYNTSCN